MRRTWIGLLAMTLLVPAVGSADESFVGTYACEGIGADGTYQLRLDIIQHGKAFEVQWYSPSGVGYSGMGVITKDQLVVGFANPGALRVAPSFGVAIYPIRRGKLQRATWYAYGDNQAYTEMCAHQQLLQPPPSRLSVPPSDPTTPRSV